MTSPIVTTEIEALLKSWRRDLRARNLAPKTVKTYGESTDQLVAHLAAAGVTTVEAVTREHVSDFITHLLTVRSPATAACGPGRCSSSSRGSSTRRRSRRPPWRGCGRRRSRSS